VNQWLWASTLLIAFEVPLLLFGAFASRLDVLVALQAAGGIASMALITLAEGFHRTSYTILAVVASVLTFAGSMVFVRFFEQELDP
jgi:multisubunit Na+/H+ antiporter MnhF subunit